MFRNLIESRRKRQRTTGGAMTSVLLHCMLIGMTVYATAHTATLKADTPKEKIEFVEPPAEDRPPLEAERVPPPPDVIANSELPFGHQVIPTVIEIPDMIPAIDLTRNLTDPSDFTGQGLRGGIGSGDPTVGTAPVMQTPYSASQVEKIVVPLPGGGPRYPAMLESQGVTGKVLAQFVVDTTGRIEPGSFKVIDSSHDLFTQAVENALPRMRFVPAEIAGTKVKQLVSQPFTFNVGS